MKLHLNIETGSLGGREFQLSDGFLTVGRADGCNVRFDPLTETAASKQHCYIEAKPDGFYLTDNQSTNGTILNGAPVQTAKLTSGDRIQFGKNGIEATVVIDARQTPQAANFRQDFPQTPPPPPPQQQQQQENFRQDLQADFVQNQAPQFNSSPPPNQPNNLRNSISNLGLQHAAAKAEGGSGRKKYVGAAIAIFTAVFLSLIVVGIMFLSIGPVAAVIAAVVAFVPAVFYILPLIWLDRFDPEPPWALASAFAWGALVAVIFSIIFNTLVGVVFDPLTAIRYSAPIFEEGSKGLGVVLLLIFLRREFDDILDGIVYAGIIALGFATVENVLYYGRELLERGTEGLKVLFVMRGVLSPFAHVIFTAMTGIGCGIARETHNKILKYTMPVAGYFLAIILHAVWNRIATSGSGKMVLIGYLVLEVPFFIIFVGFSIYTVRRQSKILKEMLAIDAARGLISQENLDTATNFSGGLGWILGGISNGKYRARRNYLRAVGKLGLSYWHIQRATAAHGQTGSFQQNPILRDEVLKWRDKI